MTTNREFADRIKTSLRLVGKDRFISRRFILNIAREKAKLLITQKLLDKTLYREEGIYTEIPCIKMKCIDVFECDIVEFRSCNKLMRSEKKLPEVLYTRYGSSVRAVFNIDNSEIIKETTPTKYIRDKARLGYTNEPKFYIKGGYLYITDSEVERVNLYLLTLDTFKARQCGCDGVDKCDTPLNYPFIVPDKLEAIVAQETLNEILNGYARIIPDERPDKNQKSV